MENTILTQIQDRHWLETDLLRAERKSREAEAARRQAQFDLCTAKEELALYDGSFRAFRDKFTGKRAQTETALCHAVQKAEFDLAAAQQELARLEQRLPQIRSGLEALPTRETLGRQAEGDIRQEWLRLEALYCAEAALPLVETALELLTERRKQFNGAYAGQVKTFQSLAEIYTAPEAAGEACKPYILRLKDALEALEITFPACSFFENPSDFLNSATKYTGMDRLNEAIDQVQMVFNRLPKLQQQLNT